MDFDKIYERIMLLKLIQSSGIETPYEMDLGLVGEMLFGKNYKITLPTLNSWKSGEIANVFSTVKIEPSVMPNVFNSALKSFVMFFRKNNDLHLTHIRSRQINATSFRIMQEIGAERIYSRASEDKMYLLSLQFHDLENIYYHPVIALPKDNLTFIKFVELVCHDRNNVANLINRSQHV